MADGLDKRQQRRARRRAALTPTSELLRVFAKRKYMSHALHKALIESRKWEATLIEQPCSAGNCVELIDPKTGENTGGWGPVGCPCQDEPERNIRDGK